MKPKALLLLLLVFHSGRGLAFPELTRHGYTQCTTCHFSPSGGGLLTPYGRQLSGELMSTWSYQNEGQLLHGVLDDALAEAMSKKGVHLGGDIRSVQIHRENWREKEGRFFLMQAQAEMVIQRNAYLLDLVVGEIERPTDDVFRANTYASQYFVQAQFTDEWSIRGGRFTPSFGIKLPDHTLIGKNSLGLMQWLKRDTIESNYLGENWTFSAASTRTTPDTTSTQAGHGTVLSVAYGFFERFKVGTNSWHGHNADKSLNMQALWAILGWTHRFFTLIEVDRHEEDHQVAMIGMSRFGFEVTKGLVPYLQIQSLFPQAKTSGNNSHYYSAGLQFFPRPHFEFAGQWTRLNGPKESSDHGYLLLHYYF